MRRYEPIFVSYFLNDERYKQIIRQLIPSIPNHLIQLLHLQLAFIMMRKCMILDRKHKSYKNGRNRTIPFAPDIEYE